MQYMRDTLADAIGPSRTLTGPEKVGVLLLARITEDYKPALREKGRAWLTPKLIASGLAVGFVNVHYPVITGFLILHLANHGNSGAAAFTAYASLILLSRFFLGGLPDRIHPGITFFSGLAAMAIGLLIIPFAVETTGKTLPN